MMRTTMGLGVVFLGIALLAALVGFGGVESIAWGRGADLLLHLPRARGAVICGRILLPGTDSLKKRPVQAASRRLAPSEGRSLG